MSEICFLGRVKPGGVITLLCLLMFCVLKNCLTVRQYLAVEKPALLTRSAGSQSVLGVIIEDPSIAKISSQLITLDHCLLSVAVLKGFHVKSAK